MAEEAEESDIIFVVMRSPMSGAKYVRMMPVVQEPNGRTLEESAEANAQQ